MSETIVQKAMIKKNSYKTKHKLKDYYTDYTVFKQNKTEL